VPEPELEPFRVTGRLTRAGAPVAGVQVHYAASLADSVPTDADGRFTLVPSGEFASAAAITLIFREPDGQVRGAILQNPGSPITAAIELGDPVDVELEDPNPAALAWIDAFEWAERERLRWDARADDDVAAHLAHWDEVAETIAAQPDPYARGLLQAAQFRIGEPDPELGIERSAAARAAVDELGLEDPRWSIYPWALARAVWEGGRWDALGPTLEALITEHPHPEVAGYLALERFIHHSSAGEHIEAAAVWSRWAARPDLARTSFAVAMRGLAPTRRLAPGQTLPALCVEELGGGQQLCLADLRGQVTVLEFWSTWCEGCQRIAGELREAHAALAGSDAPAFVSVDLYDDPERITEFLATEPLPWRHAWVRAEQRESVDAELALGQIPYLVLIDADGTIVASTPQLRSEDLVAQVRALTSASTTQ
jgi:thiol-disulfide isomerase/thioredoxin